MSMRPGPAGAESAGLNASTFQVPAHVVTQFVSEGFKYVGRIRLARDFAGAAAGGDAAAHPQPELSADGSHWVAKAVRCTPEGDVYVGRCARASVWGHSLRAGRAAHGARHAPR